MVSSMPWCERSQHFPNGRFHHGTRGRGDGRLPHRNRQAVFGDDAHAHPRLKMKPWGGDKVGCHLYSRAVGDIRIIACIFCHAGHGPIGALILGGEGKGRGLPPWQGDGDRIGKALAH